MKSFAHEPIDLRRRQPRNLRALTARFANNPLPDLVLLRPSLRLARIGPFGAAVIFVAMAKLTAGSRVCVSAETLPFPYEKDVAMK